MAWGPTTKVNYGTPAGGGYQLDVGGGGGTDLPGGGASGGNMNWLMNIARRNAESKSKMLDIDLRDRQRASDKAHSGQWAGTVPTAPPVDATLQRLRGFDRARQYMDRLENPLDRYTSGHSNLGSNFRNFIGAGALLGTQFDNSGMDLYQASAGRGGQDLDTPSKAQLNQAQARAISSGYRG